MTEIIEVYWMNIFYDGEIQTTGREWLIRSHSSARFSVELSGNLN